MESYIFNMLLYVIGRFFGDELCSTRENMHRSDFCREFGNITINPGRQCGKTTALAKTLIHFNDPNICEACIIVGKRDAKKQLIKIGNLSEKDAERIKVFRNHTDFVSWLRDEDCMKYHIYMVDDYSWYNDSTVERLLEFLGRDRMLIKVG